MYSHSTHWHDTGTRSTALPKLRRCASHRKSSQGIMEMGTMEMATMEMGTMETGIMEAGGVDEVSAKHDDQVEQVYCRQAHARRGEVPPGDDARAAARLQPDLHGMWANSRVQGNDLGTDDRRAVSESRG